VVRTIEERLNEFERTRLEARKARGRWGWWKKLGRGKMTETFDGVEFWKVLVAGKVKDGLNEFVRNRLAARKVCGRWG
jgi:hypothetical protein